MRINSRIFLLLALSVVPVTLCDAQTPDKEAASISGRLTISGKAAPGVTVVATQRSSFFDNKTVAKTVSDEDGNYKLTAIPAGRLIVMPLAKAFVVAGTGGYKQPGQPVNVGADEAVSKIDFNLVKGGVVTGRITDAEGHPLIGEVVSVSLKGSDVPAGGQMAALGAPGNKTDDRGVYRVYGLGPGTYKVSVGQADSAGGAVSIMGMAGSQYVKTFFPGVQDEAKATFIEVKEGTEVANVDIAVGKPGAGYSASGRVIDAESGQPVANQYIGHALVNESNQQLDGMNLTGNQTDVNGNFRLEGLRSGHYAVFTFAAGQDNSTYSEPAPFQISDGDVTGIEIKLRRGATVSGVAVLENSTDPAITGLLTTVTLGASVEAKGMYAPSYSRGQITADGSFRFAGLAPGKARIFAQGFPTPPKGLSLVRTEVDGLAQEGIELTAGANITGVRIVFAYSTSAIRGEVKIEGGTLPEGNMLHLNVRAAPGENRRFSRSLEIDSRNRFLLENVPPGNYELTLRALTSDQKEVSPIQPVKQTVTVSNNADAVVTLVFDVARKGGQ